MPLSVVHHQRSKGEGSLHRASFLRQAQGRILAEQTSLGHLALEKQTGQTKDMAELSFSKLYALEGRTSQKTPLKHPLSGSRQLDLDKLEQMSLKIEALEKLVSKLAGRRLPPTFSIELAEVDCRRSSDNNNKLADVDCQQSSDNNNSSNNNNHTDNNNKNTTTTNNTNNNNNEPNNYNNNNKQDSREPSFSSLDLDDDNPESQDDLERESLDGFNPGAGSGFGLDQHEANQSFNNLGHRMMAIGSSLGSLIQQNNKEQEGMQVGTAWEPSLMHYKKPKRVSFDENNLAHLRQNKGQQQEGSHPQNFKLDNLGSKS